MSNYSLLLNCLFLLNLSIFQVFSIGMNGHDIHIRTGVNSSELCGRTWKVIEAPIRNLHHSSSLSSLDSISNVSQRAISVSTFASDSVSLDGKTQSFRKISADSAVSCPVLNQESDDNLPSNDILPSNQRMRHSSGDMSYDIYQRNFDDRTMSYCNLGSDSLSIDATDTVWQPPMEVTNYTNRDFIWTWISASGCAVDSESLPNWFCEGNPLRCI